MAAPSLTHDGFLIPNAVDVAADPVLAEPDRVDFNTSTNARWGVIEGCKVSSQGPKDVFIGSGSAIVNGLFVTVIPKALQLSTPAADASFSLIVVDDKGEPSLISSVSALRPTFPDPGINQTVLASVYCKAGAATFADYIIDKRKFLQTALLTKVATDDDLIRNFNAPGTNPGDPALNHYMVKGDGQTIWANDTYLQRISTGKLQASQDFKITRTLEVGANITAAESIVSTQGRITTRNFRTDQNKPVADPSMYDRPGDLWQDAVGGRLYIRRSLGSGWAWQELATTESTVPLGTVINSLLAPDQMIPLGWYPLDGSLINETVETQRLFTIPALASNITGTAPNRSLRMPNLSRRMQMTDFGGANKTGGDYDYNILELTSVNIPRHHHSVNVVPSSAGTPGGDMLRSGAHPHTITGGWHDHGLTDPGHLHDGATETYDHHHFLAVDENGQNKIDALFNDRSHTYSVTPLRWTYRAHTGINITPSESHSHVISGGDHDHKISFTPMPVHDHQVQQVAWGGNAQGLAEPIDITPEYYTVFTYIRS